MIVDISDLKSSQCENLQHTNYNTKHKCKNYRDMKSVNNDEQYYESLA